MVAIGNRLTFVLFNDLDHDTIQKTRDGIMRRLAAFIIILLGVSACVPAAGNVALVVLGTNMTSIMYTDKTLFDHGVGVAIGQDCSMLYLEEKDPYCRVLAGQEENSNKLYCYPTLGQPECYVDPVPDRQSRISFAVSNLEQQ